ncbi:hypothetical protein CERSUDRAFT_117230 [Gelatoporia subvermispora B]|uniref:ABM domain-containing protein n=1 Tax=Ceriporiopsis subvermispora (strain B) TaxID=914234 RepID=M2R640_CERS8|nr:hypothetical protein CERSUDRAFT_117230 [Gelatoporia subvermispora B]
MSAALPCVEIAWAASADTYRENPADTSIVQPAAEILKKTPGWIKTYHGLQTEDQKDTYLYIVWETLAHHQALMKDAIYPTLGEAVRKFWATRGQMVHVQPTSEPYAALGAPVTELALIKLKPGQSKEKLEELANLLTKGAPRDGTGLVDAVWGPVVERSDTVALILGWTSVEAHWKLVTTDPGAIDILKQIKEIADIEVTHSAQREYKSALPCVEIAWAGSADAYRENPADISLVQPALDILKRFPGIVKVYHGLQTEDQKDCYIYNVWETLGHHEALQKHPEEYPALRAAVLKFWGTHPRILHVQPTSEPYAALGAPVTELALFTLKPGQSKEKLEELASLLTGGAPREGTGLIDAVWGPVVERSDMVGLILGWTSVEAHWKLVTTDPGAIDLLKQIREIADIEVTHTVQQEYK